MMRALAIVLLASASFAAEVRSLPRDLADIMAAADVANSPPESIEILLRYRGENALHSLRLGHAYAQADRLADAEQAYQKSLKLDESLHEAGIGLAHIAARQERWSEARELLGTHLDKHDPPAPQLLLYAQCAYHGGDARLAAILVERGLLRYPSDNGFRRLDIALLIEAKRYEQAAAAARALLNTDASQPESWKLLAFAEQQDGHDAESRMALEAQWLLSPDDHALRRRLAEAEYSGGQYSAAVAHFRALIGDPPSADAVLLEIGARAAAEAGDLIAARAWIDAIPADKRTRSAALTAARLALKSKDLPAADAALAPLLEQGENEPSVLLWAGSIAEQRDHFDRAEALYRQAVTGSGEQAQLAALYLAKLLRQRNRTGEAVGVLNEHLQKFPADAHARELLKVLEPR